MVSIHPADPQYRLSADVLWTWFEAALPIATLEQEICSVRGSGRVEDRGGFSIAELPKLVSLCKDQLISGVPLFSVLLCCYRFHANDSGRFLYSNPRSVTQPFHPLSNGSIRCPLSSEDKLEINRLSTLLVAEIRLEWTPPLADSTSLQLLPVTAERTQPEQCKRALTQYLLTAQHRDPAWLPSRARSTARSLTIVSFLDDALDLPMLALVTQFMDPAPTDPTLESRAMAFVRAKNVNFQKDAIIGGSTEVLIFIGHAQAKTQSISSKSSGGRLSQLPTLMMLIQHFAPCVLVLVSCDGGAGDRDGALARALMQHSLQLFCREFHVYTCCEQLTATNVACGVVSIFLFRLWAYLSQSGHFAWHTRRMVEEMLWTDAHMREQRLISKGTGKPVSLTEYHAIFMLAQRLCSQSETCSTASSASSASSSSSSTAAVVFTAFVGQVSHGSASVGVFAPEEARKFGDACFGALLATRLGRAGPPRHAYGATLQRLQEASELDTDRVIVIIPSENGIRIVRVVTGDGKSKTQLRVDQAPKVIDEDKERNQDFVESDTCANQSGTIRVQSAVNDRMVAHVLCSCFVDVCAL